MRFVFEAGHEVLLRFEQHAAFGPLLQRGLAGAVEKETVFDGFEKSLVAAMQALLGITKEFLLRAACLVGRDLAQQPDSRE